jgi:hypothetical protein
MRRLNDAQFSGVPRTACGQAVHPASHVLGVPLSKVGFPIRKSADQSFFAAPRGLSQRSTSFIASQRQGIHQMPLRHLIALIINAHPSRRWFLNQRTFLRTRGCCGGTLIRKTSLLHKIDPTARRSSFADVSEFGHQISGIRFCPIPDHRFPILDWRRRAALRHASHAALGSISSSRCQTTCTRYGRSRSVQIHDLANELSSD